MDEKTATSQIRNKAKDWFGWLARLSHESRPPWIPFLIGTVSFCVATTLIQIDEYAAGLFLFLLSPVAVPNDPLLKRWLDWTRTQFFIAANSALLAIGANAYSKKPTDVVGLLAPARSFPCSV